MTEIPVVFACEAESLVGVATLAAEPLASGVLIMVGGRQYRAGSHRQFVLLARRLAQEGYSAFRFDFRGMGDSGGAPRSFEQLDADIAAAIAAFQAHCPQLRQIVLWGLCDAATAAGLYWQRTHDRRVAGLCLANPWLRSAAGLARARTRHYYPRRILEAEFWRKLLRGQVGVVGALREYIGGLRAARVPLQPGFQHTLLDGLRSFPGPMLLLLSGRDLTAREFLDGIAEDPAGAAWFWRDRVRRVDLADADHTFSRQSWRLAAENAVLDWLGDSRERLAMPLEMPGTLAAGKADKTRILFVCMGNICRSPMAYSVVQARLARAGLAAGAELDSAGTHTHLAGSAPDPRARKAAARRGYDMSGLQSRRVRDEDFEYFDRILAMDRDNLEALRSRCPPEHRHKLGLLLEYSVRYAEREVADPYYGGDAGFESVLDLIEDAASGLVERLRGASQAAK